MSARLEAALPLLVSDDFLAVFDALPKERQKQARDKIEKLATNPGHPSLQAHRLHIAKGMWECYINAGDRLIYQIEDGTLKLWYVGDHSLIDRVHTLSFAVHTPFRRLNQPTENTQPLPFTTPDVWSSVAAAEQSANPFIDVPTSHLRILGVPADLVKTVRRASSLEALEQIDGLPAHVLTWLTELATHPHILFDPSRLIFRTTLDRLQGYSEGRIRQLMLNLTPDQQRFVDSPADGAVLLRGCAGAGKTSVLIYRAIRQAAMGTRVLLLTYSRPLAQALIDLIEELIGELPDNLQVTNLDAWIRAFLTEQGCNPQIADKDEIDDAFRTALVATKPTMTLSLAGTPLSFFRDEIQNIIKANALSTLEQYLAWTRYGRGKPLQEAARRSVWAVYEQYTAAMNTLGKVDWQDMPLIAAQMLGELPKHQLFDHILIDEAQDLTGTQFKLVQGLVRHVNGQPSLFLVGDSSQTLYTRGFTWSQVGLKLQGHSFTIRRNFRSTRQIAEAATALLAHNTLISHAQEMADPEQSQRNGPRPILLHYREDGQDRTLVRERILMLVQDQSFRLSDFAILCPTKNLCNEYVNTLKMADVPCYLHTDSRFDMLENQVKILTLHAAKGLEFPVVFIAGLRQGLLPGQFAIHAEDAAWELDRQRILLYVGMTRAAEALYLIAPIQHPSQFLSEIEAFVYHEPIA